MSTQEYYCIHSACIVLYCNRWQSFMNKTIFNSHRKSQNYCVNSHLIPSLHSVTKVPKKFQSSHILRPMLVQNSKILDYNIRNTYILYRMSIANCFDKMYKIQILT